MVPHKGPASPACAPNRIERNDRGLVARGYVLLREYAPLVGLEANFTIYDTENSGQALARVVKERALDLGMFSVRQLLGAIRWAKNHLLIPDPRQVEGASPLQSL